MNRGCLFSLLILGIVLMLTDMSCWPIGCHMGHGPGHGRIVVRPGGRFGGGGWFRGRAGRSMGFRGGRGGK